MDLFQLKPKKRLDWPHELTQIPADLAERLTARGRDNYRFQNKAVRAKDAGFVIDMDSPGEAFFCRDEALRLERVPKEDHADALKRLKEQGPITFQPALDWLEEKGLRKVQARPAEDEPPADVPLAKMKAADLKDLCDGLDIKHGKVDEMRAAIAKAAECTIDDTVTLRPMPGEEDAVELVVIPAAKEE